jgi:NAD(P)-dependent dehydrogenase (short-subunit alcohol dehydrogenase family)
MTFARSSTTDEVLAGIDLHGRVALVTGTSSGLGKETTRALASAGALVVMTARDEAKVRAACESLSSEVPAGRLEPEVVDLASLASVRAFTDRVLSRHDELHLLIANAGVIASPFGHTSDGFELQFGTNHLGHFVLVNRLVPAFIHGAPSRIVVLSSYAHQLADVDFDDPNFEHTDYDKLISYGRSKTANVLFAVELDRRLRDRGVRAFAVHPGGIKTELGRHMTADDIGTVLKRTGRSAEEPVSFKSIPAGAATSVWAATNAELVGRGGLYLEDCGVAEVHSAVAPRGVRDYALDERSAAKLWELSERPVGEAYPT